MNEYYQTLHNGVIKQINPKSIQYTDQYVAKYDVLKQKVQKMSMLRFGYLCGILGHIPNSILDIGYGNGSFLYNCSLIERRSGYDIHYKKLNDQSINIFKQFKHAIQTYHQVVCFFDSLQHFQNIDFLKSINCNYIYVSVPNLIDDSQQFFMNWKHRRYNQHIYHFNINSITNLFKQNNYSLVNYQYIQDVIRKQNYKNNILTCIFKNENSTYLNI